MAADEESARAVDRIRREAETMPLPALVSVAVRAMAHADEMCWESIARGDAAAFSRQAEASARL